MKAKNIFLRVFKLALLVFFVGNTGIVQGVIEWVNHNKKTRSEREKMWAAEESETKKFNAYAFKIVDNAKKLSEHGLYKPEQFFSDWKSILKFLSDSVDPRMIRSTETFFVNDLVLAREKSYRMIGVHQYGSYVEMTKAASEKVYPEIEKLREEIGKKRPNSDPSITSIFFFVFRALIWVVKFWFTSLPIAFLLMIYWHCRWRKRIVSLRQVLIDTLIFPKLLLMRMFDDVLDRYTEIELRSRGKIRRISSDNIIGFDDEVDADFTSVREDVRALMWNPTELKAYLDANFGMRKISLVTALLILISVRIGIATESSVVLVGEISTHTALIVDDDVGDPPDNPYDDHDWFVEQCESWVGEIKSLRGYLTWLQEKLIGSYMSRFDVVPKNYILCCPKVG